MKNSLLVLLKKKEKDGKEGEMNLDVAWKENFFFKKGNFERL